MAYTEHLSTKADITLWLSIIILVLTGLNFILQQDSLDTTPSKCIHHTMVFSPIMALTFDLQPKKPFQQCLLTQ